MNKFLWCLLFFVVLFVGCTSSCGCGCNLDKCVCVNGDCNEDK